MSLAFPGTPGVTKFSTTRRMKRNNNTKARRGPRKPAQPPAVPTNVQVVHTYRFRSTAATRTAISMLDLLGIAGAVGRVANTSLSLIANSVKLHRVSIWSPPASQGAAATCSITWSTAQTFTEMSEVSDTTLSTAVPAHVSSKPPPGSAASFWIGGTTSDTVMTLEAPVGSVIDVHCTHVLQDDQAAGASYAAAAATIGALYYLPLDGATDLYLPVSLGTTT